MNTDVPIFLTAAATTISAAFIGWQARQLTKQTRIGNLASEAQAMRELAGSLQKINLMFVEKPGLRPFFYRGVPVPEDEVTRHQVEAAAEAIADVLETGFYSVKQQPGFAKENKESLENYLRFLLANSPVFNGASSNHDWWPHLNKVRTRLGL